MDLFIKNFNSCSTIVMYQFIQLSHMTYKDFKQMVKDISPKNPKNYNLLTLEFIEPVVKRLWVEQDVHNYPDHENPTPFKGTYKQGGKDEKHSMPWSSYYFIDNVETEYRACTYFLRLVLRLITTIDLDMPEYNMELDDYWRLSKTSLYGRAEFTDGHPLPAYIVAQLMKEKSEQYEKYVKYMSKFTNEIPLIGAEIIFHLDDTHYEFHDVCFVRQKPKTFIDLNSNTAGPKTVKHYYAVVVRKTSGRWKEEPPGKIYEEIRDLDDISKDTTKMLNMYDKALPTL